MTLGVKNRWQAFAIHFAISLLIFIIIASFIFIEWYPGEYKKLGGLDGLKIIAGVDIILGPFLTLLVFKVGKKSLKFDLSVIAIVQLAALIYGTWAVHLGRPIAQVLSHNGVYIVTIADLDYYKLDAKKFTEINHKLPLKVYLDLPQSVSEINQIEFVTEFTNSKPLSLRIDLYKEFVNKADEGLLFLVKKYTHDPDRDCYLIPVFSIQENLDGCINIVNGEIQIAESR